MSEAGTNARNTTKQERHVRLLTIQEASERLGLKPATLRFWIWTRKIDHVKVGARSVRIREETVREIVERGTVPARRA
jgi:excisionase family DNA binding protein